MAKESKSYLRSFNRLIRRVLGPPFRELGRSGRLGQTLWDASQLQSQQRQILQQMGEIAARLAMEGKIDDLTIRRGAAKLGQIERLLERQEAYLQERGGRANLRQLLKESRQHDNPDVD
jgi:hypothetical protein